MGTGGAGGGGALRAGDGGDGGLAGDGRAARFTSPAAPASSTARFTRTPPRAGMAGRAARRERFRDLPQPRGESRRAASGLGGGLYALGPTTILACTFSTNTVTGGSAADETEGEGGFGREGREGGAALGGAVFSAGTLSLKTARSRTTPAPGAPAGTAGPPRCSSAAGAGRGRRPAAPLEPRHRGGHELHLRDGVDHRWRRRRGRHRWFLRHLVGAGRRGRHRGRRPCRERLGGRAPPQELPARRQRRGRQRLRSSDRRGAQSQHRLQSATSLAPAAGTTPPPPARRGLRRVDPDGAPPRGQSGPRCW